MSRFDGQKRSKPSRPTFFDNSTEPLAVAPGARRQRKSPRNLVGDHVGAIQGIGVSIGSSTCRTVHGRLIAQKRNPPSLNRTTGRLGGLMDPAMYLIGTCPPETSAQSER
jgi:hypothetical protein